MSPQSAKPLCALAGLSLAAVRRCQADTIAYCEKPVITRLAAESISDQAMIEMLAWEWLRGQDANEPGSLPSA